MKTISSIIAIILFVFTGFSLGVDIKENNTSLKKILQSTIKFSKILNLEDPSLYFYQFNQDDEECINNLKRYSDCIYALRKANENINKTCTIFENDDCKPFIEDIHTTDSGCENQKDTTMDTFIKQLKYIYTIGCLKDENNRLCPLSYVVHNKEKALIAKQIELKILTESCLSGQCKQQLYHMVELEPYTKELVIYMDEETHKEYEVSEKTINSTISNVDVNKIKQYLDDEICSQLESNNPQTHVLENGSSSGIVSENINFGIQLFPNSKVIILSIFFIALIHHLF